MPLLETMSDEDKDELPENANSQILLYFSDEELRKVAKEKTAVSL